MSAQLAQSLRDQSRDYARASNNKAGTMSNERASILSATADILWALAQIAEEIAPRNP